MISLLASCTNESKCPACMTPPAPFYFELVDKDSNQNLFTAGLAEANDLTLIDTETEKELEFSFIDENNVNIIRINSIGWTTEVVKAELSLNNEKIFTLNVDASAKSDDCCTWTEYNSVEIDHQDFSLDKTTGVYKVYL